MSIEKIPGIHNYCDRWCERCSFGSRCAIYESESDLSPEENDMESRAFWDRLAVNFSKAQQMLEQAARERGIDLQSITSEMTDYAEKEKRKTEENRSHPLSKLSLEYSGLAMKWVDSQPGMEDKLKAIQQQLDLNPESFKEMKATTETIQDCLAVIQWYETFIHVKFMRALMGKSMNVYEDEDQRDCDGSAKIALIAIERSMQAWIKLFELLPDQEDEFLKILAVLEKLKTLAIEEFPNAMAFKRPGFDD